MLRYIWIVIKGMCVGGSMVIPGVSGGSMAMILGIYDRLVSAVSSFFKNAAKNLIFLLLFAAGGGLGIILLAGPLEYLVTNHPFPTLSFFVGAIIGGMPLMVKKASVKKLNWKVIFYPLLGVAIVVFIEFIPEGLFQPDLTNGGISAYLLLALAGFLSAVALVLPGISGSYLLLMLGMYEQTMNAVDTMYLPFLIPLGAGIILGIILITKFLEKAMTKHPQTTYLIIIGFILGSLYTLFSMFPGFPSGVQLLLCIVTFAVGLIGILFLSKTTGEV